MTTSDPASPQIEICLQLHIDPGQLIGLNHNIYLNILIDILTSKRGFNLYN